MSILIKGMAMPKNCGECPLFESKYHYHGCHAVPKSFNDMDMWNFVGDRPSWCPLIELPPHGRLIDADKIPYTKIMYDASEDKFYYGVTKPYIDRMPTIIEAEKSDMDSFIHIFEEDNEEDGMDSFIQILKD